MRFRIIGHEGAVPGEQPLGRRQQARHHSQQTRFPGAVRTRENECAAARQPKRDSDENRPLAANADQLLARKLSHYDPLFIAKPKRKIPGKAKPQHDQKKAAMTAVASALADRGRDTLPAILPAFCCQGYGQ